MCPIVMICETFECWKLPDLLCWTFLTVEGYLPHDFVLDRGILEVQIVLAVIYGIEARLVSLVLCPREKQMSIVLLAHGTFLLFLF